jgi:hypothetical protein
MVFWVAEFCTVMDGYQLLEDCAASIFRVEVCGRWKLDIDTGGV